MTHVVRLILNHLGKRFTNKTERKGLRLVGNPQKSHPEFRGLNVKAETWDTGRCRSLEKTVFKLW